MEFTNFAEKRRARCPFVARAKAMDLVSGLQIDGLTIHLSVGGCCILTRRVPFSQGTKILLEITKDGVSLRTYAFVVYNLKDQFMGLCFVEMPPGQEAILAGWMKAAMPSFSRGDMTPRSNFSTVTNELPPRRRPSRSTRKTSKIRIALGN